MAHCSAARTVWLRTFRSGREVERQGSEWIRDYVPLRDAVKQAQRDQLQDRNWEKSLATLNKAYEAFVKKHGEISAFSESERTFTDEDGNETTVTYRRLKNRKRLMPTLKVRWSRRWKRSAMTARSANRRSCWTAR
jgi:N12 class adenine-specific DNA methylase